mmetsp:Transcript_24013/g.45199  ORF Transcript_24013/g.45199 Transcript_24013/m.45199 type:complete len:289 (+) Transcript_24013:192-1058(+)|eukprot:CAMPEP_0182509114 /NCGR_PEP_ID=MMETSP1321-20130603/26260_1 /TAXON_ID=91990 /ORGANISM="Bolidomonas sp., Strain RCC1657" /LENGTH=288 /DNA_ID=CAMNT_0024715329 /DNA_START=174 /DNA_END=1040 /DNA_ORIENTATION=+
METKISIQRSQNRRQVQSPEALRRRQTRRSIVDTYLGTEEENNNPNPKLERSESSLSTTSRDSSSAPPLDLRIDTSVENSSKTWGGTASKAMYNSIPSFNSPRNKSPSDSQQRLGYFGFSSPSLSNPSTPLGGLGGDDDESAGTPLPQSPTRQSGGSAFGLSALKLFGGGQSSPQHHDKPMMEDGVGTSAPILPPAPPILFASTTDAMQALNTGLPSDEVKAKGQVSHAHVATGFALGASAAMLLANNGKVNASNISKAVAFGGVAGAGSVYGLNHLNQLNSALMHND